MSYELIICEKPKASLKLATALADSHPTKKSIDKVPYYELKHKGKNIVVGCAVGHLFTLAEKHKSWKYPVFDIEWTETSKVRKGISYTKKYVNVLKKLSREANEFTIACDYDIEGEVIGLNVIRFICHQKDASRMKFSTLTKNDLIKAYENKSKHISWGLANAGLTRHELDWYYGINLSRALTDSIKSIGSFKVMSSGRVQGPALKIIVDREKEIRAFIPEPFWLISLTGNVKNGKIEAWHEKDKFLKKKEADKVIEKTKNKKAVVKDIKKTEFKQYSPFPFDLTTLQTEAYRCFRISPKETLSIAQELYIGGFISYPRTSSQKLPKEINYRKILGSLKKFSNLASHLLKKSFLKPNEGNKTDPAHPAIYPTGIIPSLSGRQLKIYDLIVKRFMATFAEPAIRETNIIKIDCNKEIFIAKGTLTKEKNWHRFYMPYVKLEEEELPKTKKNEEVKNSKIKLHAKETSPPKRYTPASIIRTLEKKQLGTKCLTSNNLVKINCNNQINNIKISELFDSLYSDFPIKDINMKIAINNKKTCFSFNEFDEIKSYFKLVSKRKLNRNEKVYRIEYKDGSHIELTEEHPILIFDGNSCKYILTKNLKKGMKSVASIKSLEKEGDIICTWKEFLKKSNLKTKLYGISDEILTKRKKENISQHSFTKKYNLLQSQICMYEKSQQAPFYIIKKLDLSKPKNICSVNKNIIIKNPFPLKMNSSLARILANLVGDCSIDTQKILKENCYDFRYHNTNINLINKFVKDIKNIFDVNLTIKLAKPRPGHLPKYYVRIPAVIGRIISILFPEVIKKNAVKIPSKFYKEFIGSLFDDEGHSMKSEPKLFISNTNFKLLENVKQMLLVLNIKSSLDKKQFKLYIRGKEDLKKFLEKIPIYSIEKKQRLIDNLSKRYAYKNYPIIKKERDILALLSISQDNELTLKEIAYKIKDSIPNTKEIMYALRKKGFIKKKIIGISKYPRKKITYKLIKSINDTFYIYIDEKVISHDFITKTIRYIKEADYKGSVYDITNNPEIPNFILSNGVVVHNSTRAQIIDTLFHRDYVKGTPIQATDIGIKTIETLEKYSPTILDEKLTRYFEEEMEKIERKKTTNEQVLEEAKKILKKILKDFKEQKKNIGKSLLQAERETLLKEKTVGKCRCGGNLLIRKGKFGRFIACDKYPTCKITFKLPVTGKVITSNKICSHCSYPMIEIIRKRRKQLICINKNCPSKSINDKEIKKEAEEIKNGIVEKECPKCKGKLVLRKSIYGSFYGCSNYPKCRYTEKIREGPLKEDFEK